MRSKKAALYSIESPSLSRVHYAEVDGAADIAGALEDGTASAAAHPEPLEGPPTGMALALGSGGVDKGVNMRLGSGPEAVTVGRGAEPSRPEEAVAADRSLK